MARHKIKSYQQIPTFWMTAALCLVILVLRDIPGAFSPPIRVEDASEMLSFYWRNSDPTRLFRIQSGYISLGPNLIGYISGHLQATVSIYLLHWFPLILAACTFSTLQLRDVELLTMTVRERSLVALALAAMPISNWALITNTMYSLWSMLIFSTVIVLFWRPKPGLRSVFIFSLLAVFSWSHPLFILLVPALAIRIYFAARSGERIGFFILLLGALAYAAFGVEWVGGETHATRIYNLIPLAAESVQAFMSRAVTEPLISSKLRFDLIQKGYVDLTVILGALITSTGIAAAFHWRRALTRRDVQQVLVILIYAGVFATASAMSGRIDIEIAWGQRYLYPSTYLLMLLVFWAVIKGIKRLPHLSSLAATILILVWLGFLNLLDRQFYNSSHFFRASTWNLMLQAEAQSAQGQPYCVTNNRPGRKMRLAEDWPRELPCTIVPLSGN